MVTQTVLRLLNVTSALKNNNVCNIILLNPMALLLLIYDIDRRKDDISDYELRLQ